MMDYKPSRLGLMLAANRVLEWPAGMKGMPCSMRSLQRRRGANEASAVC